MCCLCNVGLFKRNVFPPFLSDAMGCGSSCYAVDGQDKYTPNTLDISTLGDAASAHAYIASAEKRRGSTKAPISTEPSKFVTAVSHQCAIVRAFIVNGVTSDVNQFDDEVKDSVTPFHAHRRQVVQNWLKSVDSSPPITDSHSPWTSTSNPGTPLTTGADHNAWPTL